MIDASSIISDILSKPEFKGYADLLEPILKDEARRLIEVSHDEPC